MFGLGPATKIYVALGATDMRKGFDGLYELVNQLKERLPQALFEKLTSSLSIDGDRLKFAEYKVRVMEERLRLARIEKYGPAARNSPTTNWNCWSWSLGSTAPRSKPKVSASNWNCRLRKRANIPVANNCLRSCRESNRSSPAQPMALDPFSPEQFKIGRLAARQHQ